jgi:hypothetical protein
MMNDMVLGGHLTRVQHWYNTKFKWKKNTSQNNAFFNESRRKQKHISMSRSTKAFRTAIVPITSLSQHRETSLYFATFWRHCQKPNWLQLIIRLL